MFLRLWNYLRGYVIIRVSGFSIERFVNLAVHKKIYIWDVSYEAGSVIMKVSIKGFRLLRECSQKTRCKIHIVEKCGLPFFTYKHRKRKVFVIGIVIFVIIINILASFIWLIEIRGNNRIPVLDIVTHLERMNIEYGTFKHTIDRRNLEEELLREFPDISWINVEIKGTKITIDISETLPELTVVDKSLASDLVATKDGLIESVTVSGGRSIVKEKDVVKEGDVLVSGVLYSQLDDGDFQFTNVTSIGEVRAKTYYEIPISVPLKYEEKIYTGETKSVYSVLWFGKQLDFDINNLINFKNNDNSYENYDKIIQRTQLEVGEDYPLPIIFIKNEYREYEFIEKTRTYEEAVQIAETTLNNRIVRELPFEADITQKQISMTKTYDAVELTGVISAIERIDKTVPLTNIDETQNLIIKEVLETAE